MLQERLDSTMPKFIERKLVSEIDTEEVIDVFKMFLLKKKKGRKLEL